MMKMSLLLLLLLVVVVVVVSSSTMEMKDDGCDEWNQTSGNQIWYKCDRASYI